MVRERHTLVHTTIHHMKNKYIVLVLSGSVLNLVYTLLPLPLISPALDELMIVVLAGA